jgi:hypothetical protein
MKNICLAVRRSIPDSKLARSLQGPRGVQPLAVAQRKVRHNFGSYPCDAVANAQAVKHFRFTAAIKIAIVYYLRASISDLHVLRGKGEEVLLGMSP